MSEDTVSALDFMPSAFTIESLKRHEGGGRPYWSCQIVFPGKPVHTIHNRHGSWMIDEPYLNGKLADPEFIFGGETGRRIKFEVSTKIAPLERKISEALRG